MNSEFPIKRFLIILGMMFIGFILINKSCSQVKESQKDTFDVRQDERSNFKEEEKPGPIYKLSERDEIIKNPINYLILKPKSWYLGGFGVISMQNFDIENTSTIDIKDVSIKFTYYSESGTELSSSVETVYKTVKAKSKIKVREFNAGFVNQQTSNCRLELVNAIPIVIYN